MKRHRFYVQPLGGKSVYCNLCATELQGSEAKGVVSYGPIELHFKTAHASFYRPEDGKIMRVLAGGAKAAEVEDEEAVAAPLALAPVRPQVSDTAIFDKL